MHFSTLRLFNDLAADLVCHSRKVVHPEVDESVWRRVAFVLERTRRETPLRAMLTKARNFGSNRCSHSFEYPSRAYQSSERAASLVRRTGMAAYIRRLCSSQTRPCH